MFSIEKTDGILLDSMNLKILANDKEAFEIYKKLATILNDNRKAERDNLANPKVKINWIDFN